MLSVGIINHSFSHLSPRAECRAPEIDGSIAPWCEQFLCTPAELKPCERNRRSVPGARSALIRAIVCVRPAFLVPGLGRNYVAEIPMQRVSTSSCLRASRRRACVSICWVGCGSARSHSITSATPTSTLSLTKQEVCGGAPGPPGTDACSGGDQNDLRPKRSLIISSTCAASTMLPSFSNRQRTDIQMLGSMDGVGLAHAVHERWPSIKIIVVSGQLNPPGSDLPPCSRFFGKPLEAGQMIAEMHSMIGHA